MINLKHKKYHVPIKLINLIVILSMIVLFSGCCIIDKSNSKIEITKGFLDISKYNFNTEGKINLNGEWEFYWNKLLTYKDFKKNNIRPDIYVNVPSTWNTYKISNEKLTREGYATYRIKVKTQVPVGELISLRVDNFAAAYAFYVNGKKIASNGSVGTSLKDEKPQIKPMTVVFTVPSEEFNIIVQISNYHLAKGGLWTSIHMGSVENITKYQTILNKKEWFLIGALVILSIESIYNFLIRNNKMQNFYLAIMYLAMAIIIDFTAQINILQGLQNINFMLFMKTWYFLAVWIPFLLVIFVNDIYEIKYPKHIIKIFFVITLGLSLYYIFIPVKITQRYIFMNELFEIVEIFSTIPISTLAIKSKDKNAMLYMIGLMSVLITYIFDNVMYYANYGDSEFGEILNIGVFIFIAIQAIIQSKIYNKIYIEKEQMVVKEKQSVENAKIAELAFLQAQIKPHFLYNALNTIASFCITDGEVAASLIYDLSSYLRNSFDFENLEGKINLSKEMELVRAYLDIEKARYGDRLSVEYLVDEEISIRIPHMIIQPLVENAIKHGIVNRKAGGKIVISIVKKDIGVFLSVEDDGNGISKSRIKEILSNNTSSKSVGIKNINERLKRYYKQELNIESVEGKGTKVSMIIPNGF